MAQEVGSGPIINQKSVQLTVGTQGVGGDFSYGVLKKLALRVGGSFIPVTANNVLKISGFNSNNKVTASFYNAHLLADFTPFESIRSLRLVGGAAYFFKAAGNFDIQPTDTYTYGQLALSKDDVGEVHMNADWKGVAPYLGIGIVKVFPRHLFNVNIDLGSYYLPTPHSTIIGTGLLEGNSSQTAQLDKNIHNYRFLPVVQLNFSFKI
ncbi:hypothetical protein Mucpa_1667 [Mucilaginibacter paludis DSM 18603]|uniref:Outer membrane protein beta-barrel domain-containing protein n=2 Tax=Mucilaginibacter TaxID=423349 RepID=H1Y6I0_9SPHI|nr:hypothetical protein Mucpa_1667 [Mucilaginibacter paludis DSM 18603]